MNLALGIARVAKTCFDLQGQVPPYYECPPLPPFQTSMYRLKLLLKVHFRFLFKWKKIAPRSKAKYLFVPLNDIVMKPNALRIERTTSLMYIWKILTLENFGNSALKTKDQRPPWKDYSLFSLNAQVIIQKSLKENY